MHFVFRTARGLSAASLAIAALFLIAGCPPTPNVVINHQAATAQATVTFASQAGDIDTTNSCSPETPPAPAFEQPGVSPSDIVVGFQRWRNNVDSCQTDKTVVYRAAVTFPLPVVPTGKVLYKVTLEFDAASTFESPAPSPQADLPSCLGSLLASTVSLPGNTPSLMVVHGLGAIPAGSSVGTYFREGTLPARLPLQQPISMDSGDVTVSQALHQASHFVINLTSFYQSWTRQNAQVGMIVISTANEQGAAALPVPNTPPGGFDPTLCLAHYTNFKLDVQSL